MEDLPHQPGTYPCKCKSAIIKLKDSPKLLVEGFHRGLLQHGPHALAGELPWGSPGMQEGRAQRQPHRPRCGVYTQHTGLHLQHSVLSKQEDKGTSLMLIDILLGT